MDGWQSSATNRLKSNLTPAAVPPFDPGADLRYLRGIGPKRAELFKKLEITNLKELLYHFPVRYEDRSRFLKVSELQPGQTATLKLEILSVRLRPIPRMPMVEMIAGDDTGSITAIWYRQAYLLKQFQVGSHVLIYGRADFESSKKIQFSNAEFELIEDNELSIHTGRIVPIYGLTEGIYQKTLRGTLHALSQAEFLQQWPDPLPSLIRQSEDLVSLPAAIKAIHFPLSLEELEAGRKRLIFDEFFSFQLSLQEESKKIRERSDGVSLIGSDDLEKKFSESLPFQLTNDQLKSAREISADLSRTRPMNRLLQGDVGSGKTVVAALALLTPQECGWQGAFLVPTEILAEQHFKTLKKLLEPFKTRLAILTKSTEKKRREKTLAELKQGKIDIIVGTHSLLQDEVVFKKLGLVVIDEQHKFGVVQRHHLLERKPRPHFLIMTATPIPRSLALAVYASADFSTIRELPRGRKPVKTYWINRTKQPEVWQHILQKLSEGRQAYVVFPLIEESAKADLKAAEIEFQHLKEGVFKNFKVGLVHGKTKSAERDRIMKAFTAKELDMLVSTTVIEVGVDQPNATIMVIENAERFGLAQLHQLRGRIGRGEHASECFLFGEPTTDEGKMRLRLLTKITDGFQIAEEDLNLRGPGDLWGERQSGIPHFRLAHPIWNLDILQRTKHLAESLVSDPSNAVWIKKYLAENLRAQ